jgi:hypothetical protein
MNMFLIQATAATLLFKRCITSNVPRDVHEMMAAGGENGGHLQCVAC